MASIRMLLPDQIIPIGDGIGFVVAIVLNIALFMLLCTILRMDRQRRWREIFAWGDWGWSALGDCQESLSVLCFHLHLCLEPGLWFSGSHHCHPDLGLLQRP